MIKTIKYFLKKRRLFLLVLTGIVFAITAISLNDEHYIRDYYNMFTQEYDLIGPTDAPFVIPTVVAALLAIFIPIYEMRFKMNKVVVDQVYSLPVKREKYYLAKYIIGLIEILVPVLVSSLLSLLNLFFAEHLFNLWYFIPYLLVLILYSTAVYTIYCFFFTRGNTTIDGIINMGFSTFFVTMLLIVIESITRGYSNGVGTGNYILFIPFISIFNIFNSLMQKDALSAIGQAIRPITIESFLPIIVNVGIGIIALVLYILLNKNEKAENATQQSNSWFSYKFFVPAYFFMIILEFFIGLNTISTLVYILILGYLGYVVYRRSVKVKKVDLIVLGVCTVVALILGNIIFEIHH